MRISSPSAQVGTVLVAVVLMPMIGVLLAVVNPWWGAAWMLFAMTALVFFAARTFRGAGESSAPRPWWQMTAAPLPSALLSAVFVGHGLLAVQCVDAAAGDVGEHRCGHPAGDRCRLREFGDPALAPSRLAPSGIVVHTPLNHRAATDSAVKGLIRWGTHRI